jgi:hypothetical protein
MAELLMPSVMLGAIKQQQAPSLLVFNQKLPPLPLA